MIAADHGDANAGLAEVGEAAHEEEPGRKIRQVAIEDIPGDEDEIDRLADRDIDHAAKGGSGRGARRRPRRTVAGPQPGHRAVEVKVRSMDEAHGGARQSDQASLAPPFVAPNRAPCRKLRILAGIHQGARLPWTL